MECSNCGSKDFNEILPGILECKVCKKIVQAKAEIKTDKKEFEGTFEDGTIFMEQAGISKKWEICEKGITLEKDKNRWVAALICHSPDEPETRYIRLSWFRKSFYEHSGMVKIFAGDELNNTISALEKIDTNFDENFNWTGKFDPKSAKDIELPNLKKKGASYLCPNPKCGRPMHKVNNGRYFECEQCGEIIVMEDGNPIFDIPTSSLSLNFSSNFPINYYLPEAGITVKWLMGEWKAIVIINDPDNPEKKFLRFYWWTRDLQSYMEAGMRSDAGRALGWEAKKGAMSPNIYNKAVLKLMIAALKKCKQELGW